MVIYTVYNQDNEHSVYYLREGDMKAQYATAEAFRLAYPDAHCLTRALFEDAVYTKQLNETRRRKWLQYQIAKGDAHAEEVA